MKGLVNAKRVLAATMLLVLLCSCGGGGSDGSSSSAPQLSISFSTSQLTFQSESIYTFRPPSQDIVATLSGAAPNSTLYILINVADPSLVTVSDPLITGPTTGRAVVTPATSQNVGVGTRSTTITVRACLDSPTCATGQIRGSPATIGVTYSVSSHVRGDVVMPGVLPSGQAGNIVLRGRGFKSTTAVTIGGTPATGVTYVSDSELRASFAARAAGTYDVLLDGGSTPFSAQLKLVDVPAYGLASIPYPDPQGSVNWLVHDPVRHALIVMYFPLINFAPYKMVRYEYQSGTWVQTQMITPPPGTIQAAMTPDGSTLMVLTRQQTGVPTSQTAMLELDPVTLQTQKTTPLILGYSGPNTFAFVNDGNALIGTNSAFGTGGQNFAYLFAWKTGQMLTTSLSTDGAGAASADGSIASISGYRYEASTGKFVFVNAVPNALGCHSSCRSSNFSRNGDRSLAGGVVVGPNGTRLGHLADFASLTGVINPQGTRAYELEQNYLLHTFDLTSTPVNDLFPELGSPVVIQIGTPLAYSSTDMTISLDGKTVFIGTYYGLRVVPVP